MRRCLLLLVLVWPVPAAADVQAGTEAFLRSDFATALQEWRPLAEAGNAAAQRLLGFMYAYGLGVPVDYVKSYAWNNLAAARGDEPAQVNIRFLEGNMTPAQIADAQELSGELCAKIPDCRL